MSSGTRESSIVQAGPTAPTERVAVVDVLRGFAMFGILVVNMEGFSSPGYHAASGERLWTGLVDRLAESLVAHGAAGKFMAMFAFLFGLGFAMMMERAEARNLSFVPIQTRRLLVLLVIGLVHGFLIFYGDILVTYALAGFLLLLFRRWRPRAILIAAIIVNLLSFVEVELDIARSLNCPAAGQARLEPAPPDEAPGASAEAKLQAYGRGTLGEITRQRAHDYLSDHSEPYNIVLRRLSFFLLGLFVGRLGIFRDIAGHRMQLVRIFKWALLVGGLAHVARFLLLNQGLPPWMRLLRLPTSIVGNPALACVYAIALVLAFQVSAWRRWLSPLAAVGRTALSNYLLQSLICTTVFYSYGLALYGTLGPAAGLALAAVIFALQVPLSVWWVRRFRFGPVEWLWRSLTYGRRQPFRNAAERATTG